MVFTQEKETLDTSADHNTNDLTLRIQFHFRIFKRYKMWTMILNNNNLKNQNMIKNVIVYEYYDHLFRFVFD